MNVSKDVLKGRLVDVIRWASCNLPREGVDALQAAYDSEPDNTAAKAHLGTCLTNLALSGEHNVPMCADTGFPVFFVRIGNVARPDLALLEECMLEAVITATERGMIRPNAVEPLSRKSTGNNAGRGAPIIEYKVDPGIDTIEIIYVPKGGGSEIFGTAYRTILPADGVRGLKKFIFDTIVVDGNKTGATCAPNIVGVGVGGTSERCMAMAKQAACLRKIGSRNPDPEIRALEDELFEAINASGIGPLGMGGKTTILDLHIEFSLTHPVGTPVGIAMQCPAIRVGTLNLHEDGRMTDASWPGWFGY